MSLFQVDHQSCVKDGICAAVCPVRVITLGEDGYPAPVDEAEKTCFRCGHCVAVCPSGSLSHRDMPVGHCPPIRKDFQLSAEDREYFLRNRRSIRTFANKPVPREDILKLIDLARYAPSGCNSQCVEWLVLDNGDELHKLAGIVADWLRWMVANEPEMAFQWRMDKVLKQWDAGNNLELLYDAPVAIITHAPEANLLAASACTIALTYLELGAAGTGLGCCWAGWFHAAAVHFPSMKAALALPEGHQCFGAMMVGYPKFAYHRLPTRKSPAITWR